MASEEKKFELFNNWLDGKKVKFKKVATEKPQVKKTKYQEDRENLDKRFPKDNLISLED